MTEETRLLLEVVARLVIARRTGPANRVAGVLWVELPGTKWLLAVNGHGHTEVATSPGCMTADVPPYTVAVWWNGWLAGYVSPEVDAQGRIGEGLLLAAGEVANEATLRAALEAAIKEAG